MVVGLCFHLRKASLVSGDKTPRHCSIIMPLRKRQKKAKKPRTSRSCRGVKVPLPGHTVGNPYFIPRRELYVRQYAGLCPSQTGEPDACFRGRARPEPLYHRRHCPQGGAGGAPGVFCSPPTRKKTRQSSSMANWPNNGQTIQIDGTYPCGRSRRPTCWPICGRPSITSIRSGARLRPLRQDSQRGGLPCGLLFDLYGVSSASTASGSAACWICWSGRSLPVSSGDLSVDVSELVPCGESTMALPAALLTLGYFKVWRWCPSTKTAGWT